MNLDREDIDFLTKLANEIKTQDNRYTGGPYFYELRKRKKIAPIDLAYADRVEWVNINGGDYQTFDTYQEAVSEEMKYQEISEEEAEKYVDENYEEHGFMYISEVKGTFLTYKGLLEHIKQNGHNLGWYRREESFVDTEDLYSFVQPAWRNPEIAKLLNIIDKFRTIE